MKFLTVLATLLIASPLLASDQVKLTLKNTVVYRGEVNAESALDVTLKLTKLIIKRGSQDYPIYLVMDSPGGNIYVGEQFIQFAKLVSNLKTISIFAASMASSIVEALP